MTFPVSIPLSVMPGAAPSGLAYTGFSVPLSRGAWRHCPPLKLSDVDGATFPIQVSVLGNWPDGSLRMLRLLAPLPGGRYQLDIGGEFEPVASERELAVHVLDSGAVRVDNGTTSVCFGENDWIACVTNGGKSLFGVDGIDLRVTGGEGEQFLAKPEKPPRLIRQGPLHAVVERWVRAASPRDGNHLRFRLQFEFFAGVPGMVCNAMLVHDAPEEDFRDFRSIELVFRLADRPAARHAVFQPRYGFEYTSSRFVETTRPLDVRAEGEYFPTHVSNFEALEDETAYPHYLNPPPHQVANAVFLLNEIGAVQLEMEDFGALRPKGIRLDSGSAAFALWPEWAGPLRLQQGRRRQVRIALHFGHKGLPGSIGEADRATASLLDHYRCQLPASAYAEADFFDMKRVLSCRPHRYPRFEGWLKAIGNLHTWADFFDYGDTHDTHYQMTYRAAGLTKPLPSRKEALTGKLPLSMGDAHPRSGSDPGLENYEPIWINNEYDVIFCLGTEYLRSGNQTRFRQLRAFARHTIEVDFVSYSDHELHRRAQPPHCRNHTTAGAYPSHFWTQGLAQYYFLTGDEDALDVIRGLADKTIWYSEHPVFGQYTTGMNREMGWSVLTLVFAYEATGNEKYDRYARQLIDSAMEEPLPADVPAFNFGVTSFFLGLRSYIQSHDNGPETARLLEWYLSYLNLAIRCSHAPPPCEGVPLSKPKLNYDFEIEQSGAASQLRSGILSGYYAVDCLAYAYERTQDVNYLRVGLRTLEALLDDNPGCGNEFIRFRDPVPEGKPFAVAHRTWIAYLGALDRAGLLAAFDYQHSFAVSD